MAQKAAKSIAVRNANVLKQTHLTTLGLHAFFLFLTLVLGRPHNLLAYALLSSPTLLINFYLERIGRPRYAENGVLKTPGDDLYAEGAMTYIWDVLYWTWGCMILVIALGDELWWLWVVVPLYSAYALYDAFIGIKKKMGGMGGDGGEGAATSTGSSRRQQKMERRGEKVRYRA
ncbi:anaphase-promoting complex subunit cdc27 [Ascosphaera pollenicola]|nr:anaphase-promoting complex subunit cdc27 [Ascosphaera pollenicola]